MNQLYSFLPVVLIAVFFWLVLIRPAKRRQAQLRATQDSLEYGAEVVLHSGIYGRVVGFDEETLDLEVSPGTNLKVLRGAVARVVEPPTEGEQ